MSEIREHDAPAAAADPFVLLDATAQAELVRRGEASPVELVDAAIARIEAVNGPINAVVHKVYDRARAQAAEPVGEGAFAGVPFLVKDLLAVAGVPNTSSCRVLDGVIGEANTPYSQAFDDAGLILLGLTNTPEFGLIDTTEPALRGPSRNPWNLAHSTAGSSGGSAAAVAAGLTPMAHANDGGGSIRLPACHNGVFGLKPSRGRQRDDGFPPLPLGLPALAVEHVVSRSVRDSALMLSLSEDPQTPLGRLGFVSSPLDRPLRIALIREGAHGLPAAPDVDAATLSVARLCEDLGHTVEPAQWPFGSDVTPAFLDEWSVVAAGVVAGVCAATGCKPEPPNFEPWTLSLAQHAYALTLGRVVEVVATLEEATRQLTAFFETYDVLLSPVMRHPPKLIGDHATDQPMQDLWDKAVDNVAYTPVFNASGMPAMSVPLSWSPSGLPIGAQFAAGLGKDGLLLELAYQLEAARPWADRWAPHSYLALTRV